MFYIQDFFKDFLTYIQLYESNELENCIDSLIKLFIKCYSNKIDENRYFRDKLNICNNKLQEILVSLYQNKDRLKNKFLLNYCLKEYKENLNNDSFFDIEIIEHESRYSKYVYHYCLLPAILYIDHLKGNQYPMRPYFLFDVYTDENLINIDKFYKLNKDDIDRILNINFNVLSNDIYDVIFNYKNNKN